MNDSESDIYSLLEKSVEKDWPLKSMARNIVRAKGEVSWSDKQAFDKAVNKEKAKLKKKVDKSLLKKLDIRAVGILKGCFVKTPKPRPDGQVGAKWAILAVDDGRGLGEGAAFAKVWESCSSLETRVDQLVMVSGELSYKVTYQKEDVQKLNPQKGDLSFTIKEAYPLEDAMPMVSEALRIRINHGDPDLEKKVRAIHDAAAENPGRLPTIIELKYENGDIVDVDLGPTCRVAVTLGFLSRLSKVVQQSDTSFVPSGQIYFKQREPKPWEV
jgi:hypothetical protein